VIDKLPPSIQSKQSVIVAGSRLIQAAEDERRDYTDGIDGFEVVYERRRQRTWRSTFGWA
jgi:hypothetical protein